MMRLSVEFNFKNLARDAKLKSTNVVYTPRAQIKCPYLKLSLGKKAVN